MDQFITALEHCTICPRSCDVNRYRGEQGYCQSGAGYEISSICLHRGEEPVIGGKNGICNVFFTGCNMQCVFCQNHQISRRTRRVEAMEMILDEVVQTITGILDKGIRAVGFVSPSHVVPQVLSLISRLHEKGYHPTTVYNTNGYDNVETLRSLEGLIDVYLPDFKYIDPHIAENYSEVPNYPEVAKKSILEMYRQKGNTVICNDEGQAMTGLIIRHLVIPGNTSNSIRILEWIASELSTAVHISLMSQYNPTVHVSKHPYLGRRLTSMEYNKVVDAMMALGFYNGWLQDPESAYHYNPDFDGHHPFQDDPDEGTVIV